MKKIALSNIIAILFLFSVTNVKAQTASEIKITTSSVCKTCKKTIEKALSAEKGVTKSSLDVATKIVTVTYDAAITNPDKIRLAISNAGYDADAVKANPKAYKKLEDCCKKENAGKME
jgi:copper chaperone CopZ